MSTLDDEIPGGDEGDAGSEEPDDDDLDWGEDGNDADSEDD